MKRGQITVFAIIAIVIVGAVVMFLLMKSEYSDSELNQLTPIHIEPVYSYIHDCFEESFEESLFLVGLQGGVISPNPEESLDANFSLVSYAFKDGEISLISKEDMETEIENYISNEVKTCLEKSEFEDSYNLKYSKISSSLNIENSETTASLSVPLTVKKDGTVYRMDEEYQIRKKIRLGELYSISDEISKQLKNDSSIDITYLSKLDYNITIVSYDEENFLYIFPDENYTLGGYPYYWEFAVEI